MKTYTRHNCDSNHRTARTFLKCAVPRAAWIVGTGDYAVITWCRVPAISLHTTEDAARTTLHQVNADVCGGRCYGPGKHDIVKVVK